MMRSVIALALAACILDLAVSNMELCSKNEICVTQCGDKCLEECAVMDVEEITTAQECRRRFLDAGGILECTDEGCATSPNCVDQTSDKAQCFLTCEYGCARDYLSEAEGMDGSGCSDMCTGECSRLLAKQPSDDEDATEEEDEVSSTGTLTEEEVGECVKMCSIASECLAADEAYEFDAEDSSGRARVLPVSSLISGPLKHSRSKDDGLLDWELRGSQERVRVAEALEDRSSSEALKYIGFIDALQELDGEMSGGGNFPEGMNPADILAAMGMGEGSGIDGMSQEDMMQMMKMMMGGGSGYGDEYGGGGDPFSGYGDMYGEGGGGYGDMEEEGGGTAEYEDDFDE